MNAPDTAGLADYGAQLREVGLRVTAQRVAVLDVFGTGEHLDGRGEGSLEAGQGVHPVDL
jgi:hypothetical protein